MSVTSFWCFFGTYFTPFSVSIVNFKQVHASLVITILLINEGFIVIEGVPLFYRVQLQLMMIFH